MNMVVVFWKWFGVCGLKTCFKRVVLDRMCRVWKSGLEQVLLLLMAGYVLWRKAIALRITLKTKER